MRFSFAILFQTLGTIQSPTFCTKGKGETSEPSSYRGIALSPTLFKVYEKCVSDRLLKFLEGSNFHSIYQSAYRNERGVDEHLFLFSSIIETTLFRNKKLYTCTVDLRRAFPSVKRSLLFRRLVDLGVPPVLINALADFYKNDHFAISIDGKVGNFIRANRGVREGSISSPMLFTLFFEGIVNRLLSTQNADPPTLGTNSYPCLLYADDLVLMSETKQGLQKLMNTVECQMY
jgi:hypothetical protein